MLQAKEEELQTLRQTADEQRAALEQKLREKDSELAKLQDTAGRAKERAGASSFALLEGKLREQLGKKDRLVRALREAVKQLGAMLIWQSHVGLFYRGVLRF